MSDFNPIYGTGSDNISNSDIVDLELPSIPEALIEEKIEIKDRDVVGFKFGFIGAGQGGGKIVESFHQVGYARVGVINTADQDLASVNIPHKFKFGEQQGAGKDRSVAKKAFINQREDVVALRVTPVVAGTARAAALEELARREHGGDDGAEEKGRKDTDGGEE